MIEFQKSLPEGFRERMSMKVVTMAEGKKVKNRDEIIDLYNTELIFSRVMYLLSVDQIELENIFNYELAPVPTSMFKDNGEPRFTTTKSVLKNKISSRNIKPDAVVVDGGFFIYFLFTSIFLQDNLFSKIKHINTFITAIN